MTTIKYGARYNFYKNPSGQHTDTQTHTMTTQVYDLGHTEKSRDIKDFTFEDAKECKHSSEQGNRQGSIQGGSPYQGESVRKQPQG